MPPLKPFLALAVLALLTAPLHADTGSLQISEFAADNDGSLLDEDGEASDWIEIHNPTAGPISLDGYFLTDSATALTQWRLPDVTVGAGGYLVVFASGKDRSIPGSELHANFSLSAGGEYLALVAPDGLSVVCAFEEVRQFYGVSYGISVSGAVEAAQWLATDASLTWHVPTADIGSAWQQPGFDDSAWNQGVGGIGFGYPTEPIGAGSDTNAAMRGSTPNATVYVRYPFQVANPAAVQAMTLRARFEDGFAAFLNGSPVASVSAPSPLRFDSTATASSEVYADTPFEDFPLAFSGHLVAGENILGVQLMNNSPLSSDVLMILDLVGATRDLSAGAQTGYMETPTPGAPNGDLDYLDYVRDTKFDVDRGFYEAPFDVTITCATPGATIVYTTDGNTPSLENNVGTAVPAPDAQTPPSVTVPVATTTVLRAAAFKTGLRPADVDTQTYLFLDDVLDQPDNPVGYPAQWVTKTGAAHPAPGADYGMDPNVVGPIYSRAELKAALTDIPTVSIVTDIANLFDQQIGIQMNPQDAGEASERRVSVEMIGFPDGTPTQLDAGMRMNGNASRSPTRPKHNFRLIFRNEYGEGRLNFPLFGADAPTERFNQIVLRGGNGNAWIHPDAFVYNNAMYIRDQWFRDAHTAMGYPEALQNEVHVYFNGLYWGMHHQFERIEEEWAAERFGGAPEDWEGFRIVGGNNIEVIAGTPAEVSARMLQSWRQSLDAALAGNLDAMLEYIDLDAYIDYMLLNFHAGNNDWDQNNVRAMRRTNPPGKFMFFCHDAERAGLNAINGPGVNINVTTKNTNNGPTQINWALRSHPEYAIRFADRAYRHLFNGGALTPENGIAQWAARADGIREAMKAESARWGDFRGEPPRTLVNWEASLQREYTQWFPLRTPVTISQLRATGLYPDIDPPTYSQHGGTVPTGYPLTIAADAGDIYFTTDGSDPRLPGGGISPDAILRAGGLQTLTVLQTGDVWKYLDDGSDQGGAWSAPAFDDSAWSSGPSPLGFGGVNGVTIATTTAGGFLTTYLRKTITVTGAASIQSATMQAMIDDGVAVYVNGVEAFREGMPSGSFAYNTPATASGAEGVYDSFSIDPGLFVEGENVIAAELHNIAAGSSDLGFDLRLDLVIPNTQNPPVVLDDSVTVSARALQNGEWSALAQATFVVGIPASDENLAISEIFYNPPGQAETTEFIELMNISSSPITLANVAFTEGIQFAFGLGDVLGPGERLLLVSDPLGFETAFGAGLPVAGAYAGNLDNSGETLTLTAADGSPIRSFRYEDSAPWPEAADGDGASLVLVRPESNPDHALPENWRHSVTAGGNPGSDDAQPFTGTAGADADGNGVDDLIDYAFGDGQGAVSVGVSGNVLTVSVPRAPAADDVTYAFESSDDLISWSPLTLTYAGFEGDASATWTGPATGPIGFVRVIVQLAE